MASLGNFLRTLDAAIQTKVQGMCVIDGNVVPVFPAFPESEFVAAQYPAITYYRYNVTRATHRKHNYKENKSRNWYYLDDQMAQYVNVRHPEPYDVFYQIDVYSKYQAHDILLQEFVLRMFDNYGYLTYQMDYTGKNQTVAMSLIESLTLDSHGPNDQRIFRKSYRYRVEGWYEFAPDAPGVPIKEIDTYLHDFGDHIIKWTSAVSLPTVSGIVEAKFSVLWTNGLTNTGYTTVVS